MGYVLNAYHSGVSCASACTRGKGLGGTHTVINGFTWRLEPAAALGLIGSEEYYIT